MSSFLRFNARTRRFKVGFGGRVVALERTDPPHSASFSAPQGAVLPFSFHDKDAEDVKCKQLEEKPEERENFSMGQHDHPKAPEKLEVEQLEDLRDSSIPSEHATGLEVIAQFATARRKRPGEVEVTSVFDDVADFSFRPSMETQVDVAQDSGLFCTSDSTNDFYAAASNSTPAAFHKDP